MKFVLGCMGAFLLFLVVFPLIGMAIGITLGVVVPYLLGPAMVVLSVDFLGLSQAWWAAPAQVMLSLIWVCSILHVRQSLRKIKGSLRWYEGHYFGAANIVTFAWLLKRKRIEVFELQFQA